jgi:hypothetical protein
LAHGAYPKHPLSSAPAAVIAYVVSRRCPAALGVGENTNTGSVTSCQARLRRRAAEEGNQVNNGHHAAGHRRASARMQLAALDCEMSTRLVARRNNRQRSASFYSWITSCSTPAKSYQKKTCPMTLTRTGQERTRVPYESSSKSILSCDPTFPRMILAQSKNRLPLSATALALCASQKWKHATVFGGWILLECCTYCSTTVFLFCSYKTGNRFFFPKDQLLYVLVLPL